MTLPKPSPNIMPVLLTVFLLPGVCDAAQKQPEQLHRLKYNHPGLQADIGLGIWGLPVILDYDGDGVDDLLVNSSGSQLGGLYWFRRAPGAGPFAAFQPPVRVGVGDRGLQVSGDGKQPVVMTPGKRYPDFRATLLENPVSIGFAPDFYVGPQSQWRLADLDSDGVPELVIGVNDTRDYDWVSTQGAAKRVFDEQGRWLNGALRGHVDWAKNIGTALEPHYAPAIQLLAGGQPLEVQGRPAPSPADFDGDGRVDLVCGSLLDELTFFRNLGGAVPHFAAGRRVRQANGPIKMDLCMIEPTAVDWNGDGHPDLVVAEEDSRVAVILHTGRLTDGVPEFQPPRYLQQEADEVKLGGSPARWAAQRQLEAGGKTIRILAGGNGAIQGPGEAKWGYTVLSVSDWDHDGLPDIVVNSSWGRVVWFRNIGTRTLPQLATARPVEVEWGGPAPKPAWNWWDPVGKELVTQWRSSVQVIDLDGDGLNDLVALDRDGYLACFPRRRIDGELKLLPPQRIFRVEDGAPSVYDHSHKPVSFLAPWDSGQNELADCGPDGRLAFHGWEGEGEGGRRSYLVTARIARAESSPVTAEIRALGSPLRLAGGWAGRSGRRKFILADWNGDGKPDLLVNDSMNVSYLENVAASPGQFVFRDRGSLDSTKLAGHDTCPAIVDWNGDGIPDLLVGAEDGHLYFLENPRTANRTPE